jgi:hypothetical protein
MDDAVVFELEEERPQGDLRAMELRSRDASLHALRILDHDLVRDTPRRSVISNRG